SAKPLQCPNSRAARPLPKPRLGDLLGRPLKAPLVAPLRDAILSPSHRAVTGAVAGRQRVSSRSARRLLEQQPPGENTVRPPAARSDRTTAALLRLPRCQNAIAPCLFTSLPLKHQPRRGHASRISSESCAEVREGLGEAFISRRIRVMSGKLKVRA